MTIADPVSYTLEYIADVGGTLKVGGDNKDKNYTQNVIQGDNGFEVTAVPDVGYGFVQWSDGKQEATRQDKNIISGATYTASFAKIKYTVTFKDHNGTVLKSEQVEHGSVATAPDNPIRTGYTFTGWDPSVFTNVTSDLTVTAQYAEDAAKYNVTVAGVVGGTAEVTVDKTEVAASETVTATIADIGSGKQFKSITVTDADSGTVATTEVTLGASYTFTMPAKDVTVTVTLEEETEKTVTVGDMQGGPIYAKVQVNDGRYNVTTTGIADGKSATVKWYGDINKTDNGNTAPVGISIGAGGSVALKDNKIELKVTVKNATKTVEGNYYFSVTIDGVESEVKIFIIETTNLVDTVTITGLSVPIVGADPYDKTGLSVPSNAGYVIDSVSWFDHSGGSWTVNQFQQGRKYQININLKLEAGYQFASNRNYVLDGLAANSYAEVQWGSAAAYDAQLLVIFNELE